MTADYNGVVERSVPRLGRGVRLRHDDIRKCWMLLAPERTFRLDAVAVEIVKRVDGARDVAAIVDDLSIKFNAERDRILSDVLEFLEGLAEKRVIDT